MHPRSHANRVTSHTYSYQHNCSCPPSCTSTASVLPLTTTSSRTACIWPTFWHASPIEANTLSTSINIQCLQMLLNASLLRRPSGKGPRTTRERRDWWQYAIRCVLGDVHKLREVWSWAFFQRRRTHRLAYIATYTDYLSVKKPPAALTHAVEQYERQLTFDDIVLYRQITRARMPSKVPEASVMTKVLSYFWSSSTESTQGSSSDYDISDTEKQQIFSAIGYDVSSSSQQQKFSPSYVATAVFVRLDQLSFEIFRNKKQSEQAAPTRSLITSLSIANMTADVRMRPAADAVAADLRIKRSAKLVQLSHDLLTVSIPACPCWMQWCQSGLRSHSLCNLSMRRALLSR